MRDSNENMIELLSVSKENDAYSSLIKHDINGEKLLLRFGNQASDYTSLKRILEFRPFENSGVAPYRYFFAFSYRKAPENKEYAFADVRVEQLDRHKQYEFKLSQKYIANLLWFKSISDKREVRALIEKEE